MLASKVVFEGQGVNEKIYGLGEHRTGKVNHSSYNKSHTSKLLEAFEIYQLIKHHCCHR